MTILPTSKSVYQTSNGVIENSLSVYSNFDTLYNTVPEFNGQAADPNSGSVIDSSTPYPVVDYNGQQWLLAYSFGEPGIWSYGDRNINTSDSDGDGDTPPSKSDPVTHDWTSSFYEHSTNIGGYNDDETNGPYNMYIDHPAQQNLDNKKYSSTVRGWIPKEASQTLIVFADFYRKDDSSAKPGIVGRYWDNEGFTTDMEASWRGSEGSEGNYDISSDASNADMCIKTNPHDKDMMIYVLERGYTIQSIGWIMFKPEPGTEPSP